MCSWCSFSLFGAFSIFLAAVVSFLLLFQFLVEQLQFLFNFSCCFLFLFFVVDLGYVSDWGALFGTDLRDVSERLTLGLESGSDWVCFPMPTGMAAISECFLEGLF